MFMTQATPMPPQLYLASGSPRRQELLQQAGIGFHQLVLRDEAGAKPDPRKCTFRLARDCASRGAGSSRQDWPPCLRLGSRCRACPDRSCGSPGRPPSCRRRWTRSVRTSRSGSNRSRSTTAGTRCWDCRPTRRASSR
ncbi:MAG: hypothetical protein EBU23_11575 [Mycobacteriaceae bacterium]|nr:hypothetical protein [Mycobacteriaceae bacterium]